MTKGNYGTSGVAFTLPCLFNLKDFKNDLSVLKQWGRSPALPVYMEI